MAQYPILDLNKSNIKNLVYVKTNVGGWFFDAFLNVDHKSDLEVTEHPVQTGASISDHSFLKPKELSMKIGMSDSAKSLVKGQFTGSWSRSVSAYKILKELQRLRVPIQIMTRLGVYKNMLVTSIVVSDDYTTLYGLRADVTFKEVLVAQVRTVKLSKKKQVTGSTNAGTPEVVQPNQSILKQFFNLLGR